MGLLQLNFSATRFIEWYARKDDHERAYEVGKGAEDLFAIVGPPAKLMTARAPNPILLVEDDDDLRASICQTLESSGHRVIEAPNGKVALHYLVSRQEVPFVILLDLMMPVMSGWDFLAVVQNYARLSKIPVIIISVHEPTRNAQIELIANCKRYLKKPFSDDVLLSAVDECASQRAHG